MDASMDRPATGRGLNIAAWVASALVCALFLFAGVPKWMGAQQAVDGFRSFGFSDGFRIFIGLAETAGGIGVVIPRLAFWAACGLVPIMIGAIHTQLTHPETGAPVIPSVTLLVLLFIAWARRKQALFLS